LTIFFVDLNQFSIFLIPFIYCLIIAVIIFEFF
jgi:hypothetical protein